MKLAWERMPALCFLALLAACDRNAGELERQHALWTSSRPSSYSYTIQLAGRRRRELLHPKRVTVEPDGSVAAVHLWSRAGRVAGQTAEPESFWTIDDVFEELLRSKRAGAGVRARFDETYGFVERAFVESESGSWDVDIRGFEASD